MMFTVGKNKEICGYNLGERPLPSSSKIMLSVYKQVNRHTFACPAHHLGQFHKIMAGVNQERNC